MRERKKKQGRNTQEGKRMTDTIIIIIKNHRKQDRKLEETKEENSVKNIYEEEAWKGRQMNDGKN